MQAAEARTAAPAIDEGVVALPAPLELVTSEPVPPALLTPAGDAVKRGLDLVVALVALIVLAPLFAAIALVVRIESRGPVFYRQRRVGRGGGEFEMFKFRTMVDGAHALRYELVHLNEAADGLFKIARDPRVTRVGRALRRTHLDELPQLIDVALGHMSLVGPRPLVPEEDALIGGRLRERLAVRPGMTGAWQVTGDHELGLAQMAELDLDYIESWSPLRDLRLIGVTAMRVAALRGK